MRRFPIQGGLTVSWSAAERAYDTYAGLYGRRQSLSRLAERGGFGLTEFVVLYDGLDPQGNTPKGDRVIAERLAEADVRPAEK